MKMKSIAHIASAMKAVVAIAMLALMTGTTQALTYTWDPSNVTGTPPATLDWFTSVNPLGLWTGPVIPLSASDTEIRFFADTSTSLPNTAVPSTQTANLNNGGSAFQLGTLTLNGFGSATSGASLTMTLQGDDLNFSAATGTISFNSVKNVAPASDPVINYTINNNIQLGTAGSASALTLTGNGDSAGTTTYKIDGSISELQTGGGSLLKSGSSLVTINGAVNITGGVTVSAGRLTLSSSTINASTLTVNGGTLILTGNLNPASGSMTVNSGGILQIGNNTATQFGAAGNYSGNISTGTGGTLRLWSSSAQEISGIISGSGGINKAYGGALTLSGVNTYTGKSQFIPQNTAGFTQNVASFNSVFTDVGLGTVHSASSTLGAPTTVVNGTIDIGGNAQAGITLNYTGPGETTDRVLAVAWNGNSTQTIQASGGGLLKFTSPFTAAASGGTGSLVLTGAGNAQVNGITGSINTTGLSKTGNGTWTISGPSTFTQPTTITAGTLSLTSATALQNSPFSTASALGTGSVGLKIATTTLTLGGLTGANALRGRFTTALGGPSSATAQGGYDGLTDLTLNTAGGSTLIYTGAIAEGATGMSLTKTGAGIQTITSANTYTGNTIVNGGFLTLNGSTLAGGLSVSNATFAGNSSFAGLATVTSGGVISPGASLGAIGTLTLNDATASALTLDGSTVIFDLPATVTTPDQVVIAGGLVLNGANTVILQTATTGVLPGTYDLMTFTDAPTGAGSLVFANGTTTMGNASLSVSAGLVQLTVAAGGLAGTTTFNGAGGTGNVNNWTTAARWNTGVVPSGAVNVTLAPTGTQGVTANDDLVPTYSGNLTINPGVVLQIGWTTAFPLAYNALGTPGSTTIFMGAGSQIRTRNAGSGTFSDIVLVGDANVSLGESTQTGMAATFRSITGPYAFSLYTHGIGGAAGSANFTAANSFTTLNLSGSSSAPLTASAANSIGTATVNMSSGVKMILNATGAMADSANIIRINNGTLEQGTGAGVTAALSLPTRPIELNGAGGATINNANTASSSAYTLSIGGGISSTAAGAKTLTLGGANTGINTISGNIIDGAAGSIALTKADGGIWALSGINTYSGNTSLSAATSSRLIFQGSPSLSPNTILIFAQNSGAVANVRFLDDGAGTINFNRPIEFDGSASGGAANLGIFVGNNNTANQGSSAGTTTGSTIQVGNITHTLIGPTLSTWSINVTGANDYRLRIGTLMLNNLTSRTAAQTVTTILNPTTANMTVDAITMANGNVTASDGIPVLRLGGTSSDNIVTGDISNASDYLTGHSLSVQKQDNNTWTLQGNNTYTGSTTINNGKLVVTTAGSGASSITIANTAGCILGVQVATANGQWVSTSDLTVAGVNSKIEIDYGATVPTTNTSQDPLKVANLTVSGVGTLKVLGDPNNFITGSTHPLINFTGTGPTAADPYNGMTLSLPDGMTGHLKTIANHVVLVVDFAPGGVGSVYSIR